MRNFVEWINDFWVTMKFTFREMTEPEAIEISEWHYDPPYDFYDLRNDMEDAREFLDFTTGPGTSTSAYWIRTGTLLDSMNSHVRTEKWKLALA